MLHRHVKLALLGELEDEDFRACWCPVFAGQRRHALVEPDAVMQMHDVVAVRDLRKIERLRLAAQVDQPLLLAQRAQRLVAAENLRVAQHDELARRPDEAAQQRALVEGDVLGGNLRLGEDFLQALLLALVVAEDHDFPALGHPVAQVIEEKLAAIFLEDEVAARRVEEIVREELHL